MNALPSSIKHQQKALYAPARILVVDDSATQRAIVCAMLAECGVGTIEQAENGKDALAKLDSLHPDLIVLDIAMPVMDGLEFCEQFRSSSHPAHNIPIIVMTGMDKSDERMRALRVGVSSILFKPIKQEELCPRIFLHLQEVALLEKLASGKTADAQDLQTIMAMQSMLLPSDDAIAYCNQTYRIDINAMYKPCADFGGDYWTLQPINDHTLALFIADCSGHGIPPAVYTFRLHKFLREYARYYATPAEVLEELNHALHQFLPAGMFITCTLAFIDTHTHRMTYASAGHPPLILYDGTHCHALDGSGEPLGAYAGVTYINRHSEFRPGQVLILFSDALVEENEQGQKLFTPDSLLEYCNVQPARGAGAIYARILQKIHQSRHVFSDDLTLLCVARE